MIKLKKINIIFCLLLILWMTFIFLMSMQPAEQSSQLSGGIVSKLIAALFHNFDSLSLQHQADMTNIITFIVRKAAHFSEYFILSVLAYLAIPISKSNVKYTTAFVMCVLYAVSDEIHQYFVPGRACRALDVCIYTLGILVALFVIFIILNLFKRRKLGEINAKKETY